MKIKIKELNQGDKFEYGAKSAIVLDKMDDGVLCMVVDENYQCRFDEKKHNNFAESTLRTELNVHYMIQWIDEGANPRDFVKMEVDLTADDGLDDYGTCKCYLAPRTCDQHRKYRKLISICDGWEWTVTPWSTKSNGDFQIVRDVYTDGSLDGGNAYNTGWVRPLFKLKPDIKVEVDTTNGVGKCCLVDTMRKLVDEHGFPVVMETLAKVIVG